MMITLSPHRSLVAVTERYHTPSYFDQNLLRGPG